MGRDRGSQRRLYLLRWLASGLGLRVARADTSQNKSFHGITSKTRSRGEVKNAQQESKTNVFSSFDSKLKLRETPHEEN